MTGGKGVNSGALSYNNTKGERVRMGEGRRVRVNRWATEVSVKASTCGNAGLGGREASMGDRK